MNLYRLSITVSAMFHAALATALAYQAPTHRELQWVAGRDSVQSITIKAVASRAEPSQLDAPVIVTPTEVRIDQRRFVETSQVNVARQPNQGLTESLSDPQRAETEPLSTPTSKIAPAPNLQRKTIDRSEYPRSDSSPPTEQADSPNPVQRTARRPQPTVNAAASAAVAKELGADTEQREPVVTPPVFTVARPPVFPTEAERHGWTGVVMLTITVDVRGLVTEVEVLESSGYATLDAAAVRAVRTWRGKPAMRDGAPFESKWRKPIRFQ